MRAGRDPKEKVSLERFILRNRNMFAETTEVVAAPHVFACVVIPQRSYIFQVSSKSVQVVLSHSESKFGHSHYFGYWRLHHLVLPYSRDYSPVYVDKSCL